MGGSTFSVLARRGGIPQHAREAGDVLLLSLEGQASSLFLRAPEQHRSTFANGIGYLRAQLYSLHRQKYVKTLSAQGTLC